VAILLPEDALCSENPRASSTVDYTALAENLLLWKMRSSSGTCYSRKFSLCGKAPTYLDYFKQGDFSLKKCLQSRDPALD